MEFSSFNDYLSYYGLTGYSFEKEGINSIEKFRSMPIEYLESKVFNSDKWKVKDAINMQEPGTNRPSPNIEEHMTEADEVKKLLKENGLESYIQIFEEQHLLDRKVLSSLTKDDYRELGISLIGDRKKMELLFSTSHTTTTEINNKASMKEESSSQTKTTESPQQPQYQYTPQEKKSGGGVWVVVGVLLCVLLTIVIVGTL